MRRLNLSFLPPIKTPNGAQSDADSATNSPNAPPSSPDDGRSLVPDDYVDPAPFIKYSRSVAFLNVCNRELSLISQSHAPEATPLLRPRPIRPAVLAATVKKLEAELAVEKARNEMWAARYIDLQDRFQESQESLAIAKRAFEQLAQQVPPPPRDWPQR